MKVSAESKLRVGPSRSHGRWLQVLNAETLVVADLRTLMWEETPGIAFYELKAFLSGIRPGWRPTVHGDCNSEDKTPSTPSKNRLGNVYYELQQLRDRMGSDQRKLDLGWLRLIRRDAHLSMFLGGGSRSLRGNLGFLWNLVLHLMTCAVSIAENTAGPWYQYLVSEMNLLQSFPLSKFVICGGAQTAALFFREGLFKNVVEYTYMLFKVPGRVHRAIAELTEPVTVSNKVHPGLRVIVTQSLDDLVGEAIDDLGLRRKTLCEIDGKRVEETNAKEFSARPSDTRLGRRARLRTEQVIYHTNGWIPRRIQNELISDSMISLLSDCDPKASRGVQTPRDEDEADADRRLQKLMPSGEFLREAAAAGTGSRQSHVLLLGVSFDDSVSETLLAHWSRRDMWPQYYALLRWPAERMGVPYPRASGEVIREACKPFFEHLVQPIWFDSADEIPGILRELV